MKVPANILVTGISGHLSDEVIELFFEKESKSVQEEFGDVLEVKQTIYGHIVRFGDEKGDYVFLLNMVINIYTGFSVDVV